MKTSGGSTRRSYVAWGPTYQVLYPAVTVGRVVAPLASVADITIIVGVTVLDCVGLSGPYAGGVQTNRPLSGRGLLGYMHLHGAWPLCMAIASGRAVVGFKLVQLLFRRLNMHMKLYV